MKANKQPCIICKDHKSGLPFNIRADNAKMFAVSHICNCPYCGRFLSENYTIDIDIVDENNEIEVEK